MKGRRRGRQPKHWAEKARILTWYFEVRRRCGWSDYRLDLEFAWTKEGMASRETDYRPRMFESMRVHARLPSSKDRRWRNMDELLEAVDQHELFHGTKALYKAEIWDLFQERDLAKMTILNRVRRLLEAHGLRQVDVFTLPTENQVQITKMGHESFYNRCLHASLNELDQLNQLALVWLLHAENEAVHNWPIRAVLQSHADELLDNFFDQFLPDDKFEFYGDAIRALLGVRVDLEDSIEYGALERYGKRPVLPESLVRGIPLDHSIFVGPTSSMFFYLKGQ